MRSFPESPSTTVADKRSAESLDLAGVAEDEGDFGVMFVALEADVLQSVS